MGIEGPLSASAQEETQGLQASFQTPLGKPVTTAFWLAPPVSGMSGVSGVSGVSIMPNVSGVPSVSIMPGYVGRIRAV